MSTQSFASARSLSNLSRRTAVLLAAALAAITLALVVVALNTGTTTQPSAPAPVNATPARTATPVGVGVSQSSGPLTYGHSFAPAGSQQPQNIGAPGTAFAGQR